MNVSHNLCDWRLTYLASVPIFGLFVLFDHGNMLTGLWFFFQYITDETKTQLFPAGNA